MCGRGEVVNIKYHQILELGYLGANPLGGSCNSWGARCMDKFFTWRIQRYVFTTGVSQREMGIFVNSLCREPG